MKFGISDLLAYTAVVAIYSAMAGFGLFGSFEDATKHSLMLLLCLLFAMLVMRHFSNLPMRAAGAELVRLKIRWPVGHHVNLAIIFLIFSLISEPDIDGKNRLRSHTPYLVIQTYAITWCFCASLCESGVLIARKLHRFEESNWRLKQSRGQYFLEKDRPRSVLQPWFSETLLIPEERVEDVRRILDEKQGTTPPADKPQPQ